MDQVLPCLSMVVMLPYLPFHIFGFSCFAILLTGMLTVLNMLQPFIVANGHKGLVKNTTASRVISHSHSPWDSLPWPQYRSTGSSDGDWE